MLISSSTQHTTLETSTTFYGCTPHSPTRAISALSLNAYHRISTNWSSRINSRVSVPSSSRSLLNNCWNVWRYWRMQGWSTVIWNPKISFLNRKLASVGPSWLQATITPNQSHWFRIGMSWNADCLYVYSISILPISRSLARFTIFHFYRYVVFGLYCRRALPWVTALPRNKRV